MFSTTPGGFATGQSGASGAPVFAADRPVPAAVALTSPALSHVAELLVHRAAETPVTVGLFGVAGSGKSQAAETIVGRAKGLAAAASGASPFIPRLAVVRLSAPSLGEDVANHLAARLHDALSSPADGYAALACGAAHAVTDPLAAAREANRQFDETRRQLDAARQSLAEIGGRRARLAEVMLYETPGSGVDAYAHANRARLEARLRAFGFAGDPVTTWKDLVRDVAGRGGFSGRIGAFLRSLWFFEGQARLILRAILFFLIAWGAGFAQATSDVWLPWLRHLHAQMEPVANWIGGHQHWLGWARLGTIAIACLSLLTNVWRSLRFLGPLWRGARLLRADIAARGRDIDAQIAHQTRRVDALAQEAETHGRLSAEAEKRVGEEAAGAGGANATRLFSADGADRRGADYIEAIGAAIARGDSGAPGRALVVLDDLDALPAERAARLADDVSRLLARPGYALLICADPARLAAGHGGAAEASARLRRLVQIPVSIAAAGGDDALRDYARGLITGEAPPPAAAIDASRSALDQPFSQAESTLLATLAPLSGDTPRAVKRYLNIYRLARARGGDFAALALMLALDVGGATGELNALGAALDAEDETRDLFIHPGEPRLVEALGAVNAARGKPLTVAGARAAWALASEYRSPL